MEYEEMETDDLKNGKSKKKFYFILLSIIISLILIILIILIFTLKKSEKQSNYSEKYSFSAVYFTEKENQTINLIYKLPTKEYVSLDEPKKQCNITKMIVDNEETIPSLNYTFLYQGNHIVNFWIDILNCDSLEQMFQDNANLISINFTENFNTKNIITMDMMFFNCINLTSLDLSIFNTENVYNFDNLF